MTSSDDEGEAIPQSVTEYHFVDDKDEPISFSILPIQWDEGSLVGEGNPIFLHGKADSGLQKVYKQVTAWKLDVSDEKPEMSVLSKENSWIKLEKPRKSFEDIIRSILITVHCLHFLKRNPEASDKVVWDHLRKLFSSYENRPSQNDLSDQLPLISSMIKRDEELAKSKFLLVILEEKPKKRKVFDEDAETASDVKKSKFIVDDDEDMDGDGDAESDEEPDLFDSVCAICDNGGELLCCEGRCLRSFHATKDAGAESQCASLGLSKAEVKAIQNFLCANCQYNLHQCFACGKLGSSDKSSGAEVFRCVSATCGHFYHPECVAKLLHPGNDAEAEVHIKKIAAGESFTCPVHKCQLCKKGENKEVEELQFAICRRCPKAYHRKCLPRKIAFEDIEEEDIIQRAWDDLIPNRILIYCLKHTIDEDLGTPPRNHIVFPNIKEKKKVRPSIVQSSKSKVVVKQKHVLSKDSSEEKVASIKLRKVCDKNDADDQNGTTLSKKSSTRLSEVSNKYKATDASKKPLSGSVSTKSNRSSTLEDKKASAKEKPKSVLNKGLDSVKSMPKDLPSNRQERTVSSTSVTKKSNTSLPIVDSEAEQKILALVKRSSSSSLTLEDITKKHKLPSTHVYSSRHVDKSITQGKVEGYVEAARTALQKLEEGCSIEDAQAVCEPEILNQIIKWKNKLKVYLSPFLHGMRYTSFGRHFTKVEKLNEIVEKLHWYVQSGDMIVDFCCGANDFSHLMKSKLEETGKRCFFKNYDVIQPKHDFNFEKRDWMTVRKKELPTGSQLIMGLNPPFGVKASLANKFIDKALEFKPKLLILIVPKEIEGLDKKEAAYDLLWEDDEKLTGKSFYLPGSVDVHDKQMEQWNLKPPLLYMWSRPDWTAKHKAIAIRQGHISKEQESPVKEYSEQAHVLYQRESPVKEYSEQAHVLYQRESPVEEYSEQAHVLYQREDGHLYGDISEVPNELPLLNDRAEVLEEMRTINPEEQKEVLPLKNDSQTNWNRSEVDSERGQENHRYRTKRSRRCRRERDYKMKQSRLMEKTSESEHGRNRSQVGEFHDEGTTRIGSPQKRTVSPLEAFEAPLERAGSADGFQHFQNDRAGETGYERTRMSIPDDELDDIERRYRADRAGPFSVGAWSTNSSGIRGMEERLPSYLHDNSTDGFNLSPYSDVQSVVEKYGRPVDLPQRNRHPLGQDSGLGQTGLLSASPFGLSILSSDPSSRQSSSVTKRYAPRLDEMNYMRQSPFTTAESPSMGMGPSSSYAPPSRGGFHSDMHGFATGPHPHRHFPNHNSSGWLND